MILYVNIKKKINKMSKISEVVTKDYLIDELRRTDPSTDRIAFHINSWAASIFGIFNFYEKDFPGDGLHKKIKAELAEMVDGTKYRPLFQAEKRPMTPSEIMMICCGFESQMTDTGYPPRRSEMQAETSGIHKTHFKELIAKGKALVRKMSKNESFTSFMTGITPRSATCDRYWSPEFKYAMFGMSFQPESQSVGDRFIELMSDFFITDKERRDSNFGTSEFMTKLKIKHTLAALGFGENEFPAIVKKGRSRSRSRSNSRGRSNSRSRSNSRGRSNRSRSNRSRSNSRGGSSLRRKKRKSTKRRKS